MTTMMHWSPFTSKFHLHHHHVEDLFPRFVDGAADEAAPPAASWLPAVEGRLEDGTYIIQFALPGVDPKAVEVSVMDNLLTIKGERKANHDPQARTTSSARSRTARSSGASPSPRVSTPPRWRPSTRTACSR